MIDTEGCFQVLGYYSSRWLPAANTVVIRRQLSVWDLGDGVTLRMMLAWQQSICLTRFDVWLGSTKGLAR